MRLAQSTQVTTLADVVAALGGELHGASDWVIDELSSLRRAHAGSLSFIHQERYLDELRASQAGGVIVPPSLREHVPAGKALIVTPDPYLYFARLSQWWVQRMHRTAVPSIHASAVVHPGARIEEGVTLGPGVVVEAGAHLARGVKLGAHCVVGPAAAIGSDTRLASGVHVAQGCTLGARGIVHSGVVIGADGFGFAPSPAGWVKIEQLGNVAIGDDVEIGANTCIDRGALEDTEIGHGVKLDNLIQIGHNVKIGEHTAMAGCVGVAGSAVIGARCMIGGAAMILGHLRLADDVHISVGSVVMRSILKPGLYSGVFPIDDNASWEKNAATLRQLHGLRERLRALEARKPPGP